MNQTQRVGAKPSTAAASGTRPKIHQDLNLTEPINETGSKDKRLTMLPEHIKRFIIDQNRSASRAPVKDQSLLNSSMQNSTTQQKGKINMDAYNAYFDPDTTAPSQPAQDE